jgi:predicted dehydrogenase
MDLRLVTVNPGHFHAALVQKEMYDGVDRRVHVYGPLGGDLIGHLQRLAGFNARAAHPTSWEVEVHAGPDSLERAMREKPGDILVLAGKNAPKIDAIAAGVRAGMHVLADKPWILVPEHLAKLSDVLDEADRKGLIAYDIMTERYEITSMLQRDLIQAKDIFGDAVAGSAEQPGVIMESVHFLKKLVAGAPLRRPAWFFDVHQQGEGLSDVGPHLVDLAMWMLFPGQAIDADRDIVLTSAKRWPTILTLADFQAVTGETQFPDFLAGQLDGGTLPYFCNTQVCYQLRGIHVKLDLLWGYEAEPGTGDTHLALVRGSRSSIEIHQGKDQSFKPELYVVAQKPGDHAALGKALAAQVQAWQKAFAGVGLVDAGGRWWVTIPDAYRVGHEAHFGEVTRQFLRCVRKEQPLPAWENPNMRAKYAVTTKGVALARA